jgi:hypothetical protein
LQLDVALAERLVEGVCALDVVVAGVELDALEGADCGLEGVVRGGVVLGEHAAAAAVEVDGGEGEVRHGCR